MKSLFNLEYVKINLNNLEKAYEIQRQEWPDDPDYKDLYDKAINSKDDNVEFLVYEGKKLIGITGVDVFDNFKDSIWLNWFTILPKFRRKGYGEKVLLDTIEYCKNLNRYNNFRIDTTYYKDRPALFLYDKVMELKEEYIIEDTIDHKNNFLIYTIGLNGKAELWNNKYLGLRKYYDSCKLK